MSRGGFDGVLRPKCVFPMRRGDEAVIPLARSRFGRVAYSQAPFSDRVKIFGTAPGASIAEILADMPQLPPGFVEFGTVRINDVDVPRAMWARVRPKPDQVDRPVIMTLHVAPGHSQILRTIATVAVLVAAVVVSAGFAAPLLGASFAAGTIGASLLGAGIAIGGSLAIAALTPSPTLADSVGTSSAAVAAGVLGSSGAASAASSSASLAGNVVAKGRALPRSIGTNRLFPPLACQPLIDFDGIDEIVEGVFILAGPHQIATIQIGESAIADLAEVQFEVNDGTNPAAFQVALVQRQGATDAVNVDMSVHHTNPPVVSTPSFGTQGALFDQSNPTADLPVARVVTSHAAADEIWITLGFSQGIYYTADSTVEMVTPFRLRMRQKATPVLPAGPWINLPEIHFSTTKVSAIEQTIKLIWGTAPSAAANPPPPTDGAIRAFKRVAGQNVGTLGVGTAGWIADTWFENAPGAEVYSFFQGVGFSNVANVRLFSWGAGIYLGGLTFQQVDLLGKPALWEIEITQGGAYKNGDFTETTYVLHTPYRDDVFDFFSYYITTNGVVGYFAVSWDFSNTRYKATIPRVASVWNQHPIQTADFCSIAIKAKSRALEQLSCLASAYVPDWNGSAWTGTVISKNPATHFRAMLVDSAMNKSALPTSLVDDAQLVTWRARCITKNYFVNCVLEGQSLLDGLNLVAAAGYARPRMSEKWGVVQDYDRSAEAPVQVFSSRNMRGFSYQKAFPRRPDGLRIQFRDEFQDYVSRQIEVNDPSAVTFNVYQEISYDSLTTQGQAQNRALFDIAQFKLRGTFYTAEVPIEAIVAVRGDLVAVNHDILSDFAGAARIKSITRGGGRVTQIVLDGTVPGPNSGVMGISVRLADGTTWTQATNITSSAETSTITFAGSGPLDPGSSLLTIDCLVVTGKSGTEYKRMILFAVQPKQDFTAQITLVDEAPTLPF